MISLDNNDSYKRFVELSQNVIKDDSIPQGPQKKQAPRRPTTGRTPRWAAGVRTKRLQQFLSEAVKEGNLAAYKERDKIERIKKTSNKSYNHRRSAWRLFRRMVGLVPLGLVLLVGVILTSNHRFLTIALLTVLTSAIWVTIWGARRLYAKLGAITKNIKRKLLRVLLVVVSGLALALIFYKVWRDTAALNLSQIAFTAWVIPIIVVVWLLFYTGFEWRFSWFERIGDLFVYQQRGSLLLGITEKYMPIKISTIINGYADQNWIQMMLGYYSVNLNTADDANSDSPKDKSEEERKVEKFWNNLEDIVDGDQLLRSVGLQPKRKR